MSKKVALQKPPAFRKIINLPLESLSQLSTLRTRQSKHSNSNRNIHTDRFQNIQQILTDERQQRSKVLCDVLSNSTYSHRPISIVSLWSWQDMWLDVLLQQLNQQYNGWMEDDYKPHFSIVGGQLADTFILLQDLSKQKKETVRMLFQYSISDTIFLVIRENDLHSQNKMFEFCERIGDTILYDTSISNKKPALVLCKVSKNEPFIQEVTQTNWRSFINQIVSWRHFDDISVIEICDFQFQNILQLSKQQTSNDIDSKLQCCAHIKEIIKKNGKPQQVLGQIVTGKIMSNFIKQLYISLTNDSYTNLLNIIKDVVDQQKLSFQRDYAVAFNRLMDLRMNNSICLRRYGLFKSILESRVQAAKLFNNFGVTGRNRAAKAIQRKQLQFIGTQIQYKRQQINFQLFQSLANKYLTFRPVSFTKCKKMIEQLSKQYINDGLFEDMRDFMLEIIVKYSDQLLLGDELNGLRIMDSRIDTIIKQTIQDIKGHQQKLGKLQNKQFVRFLEYTKKTQLARNIRKILYSQKSSDSNTLEVLMIQKISGQMQRIQDLRKVVKELDDIQSLADGINNQEIQYDKKMKYIKQLNADLLRLQNQKQNQEKRRKKKMQQVEAQKAAESQLIVRKQQQQKAKEQQAQIQKKKKRGIFGCFGC